MCNFLQAKCSVSGPRCLGTPVYSPHPPAVLPGAQGPSSFRARLPWSLLCFRTGPCTAGMGASCEKICPHHVCFPRPRAMPHAKGRLWASPLSFLCTSVGPTFRSLSPSFSSAPLPVGLLCARHCAGRHRAGKREAEPCCLPPDGSHSLRPVLFSAHLLCADIAVGTEDTVWSRTPRALLPGAPPSVNRQAGSRSREDRVR